MTAIAPVKSGPGTLTIGVTGAVHELHLRAKSAVLEPSSEIVSEKTDVISGDVIPEEEAYSATLKATIYIDLDAAGFTHYCYTNKGAIVPFEYVPNIAGDLRFVGQIKIVPHSVGGDANTAMTTDVEFACVEFPDVEVISP